MRLMSVYLYEEGRRWQVLYNLLQERTPEQSISHKGMPTYEDHKRFVESNPYAAWYFLCGEDYEMIYGSMYLTRDREIGLFVFEKYQHQGVGSLAMKELMKIHKGPFYANISPENEASQKFFERHGFRHIQNTYKHDSR